MQRVEPGTMPSVRVKSAVEGLEPHMARKSNSEVKEKQRFRHWTIRDYAHAYTSGRLTPTQVPACHTHRPNLGNVNRQFGLCINDINQRRHGPGSGAVSIRSGGFE